MYTTQPDTQADIDSRVAYAERPVQDGACGGCGAAFGRPCAETCTAIRSLRDEVTRLQEKSGLPVTTGRNYPSGTGRGGPYERQALEQAVRELS